MMEHVWLIITILIFHEEGRFHLTYMMMVIVLSDLQQGCISCGILLSGTGARGVSSEHMENVEMFSENCALVWLSENRDLVLGEPCSGPQRTVLWLSENRALVLGET